MVFGLINFLKFLSLTILKPFRRACISVSAALLDHDFDDFILHQFKGFWGFVTVKPLSILEKSDVEKAVASTMRILLKLYDVVSFINTYLTLASALVS